MDQVFNLTIFGTSNLIFVILGYFYNIRTILTYPCSNYYMHHTKMMYVGASMEVNISHRSRQDILTTADLAHPDLFRNALNEIIQLMKMVSITK